jgi:lambda family phage portal protein
MAAETDRLLAGWKFDSGFSAQDIAGQLGTIRARSRDMQKNSPHFRKFLLQVATNLVGEGFSFKSMPQDGPPSARRLDKQAADFIEYHFWRWSTYRDPLTGRTYADLTGRKTGPEIDRMNAKGWARDGEYFMLIEVADNPYGFALRVVRPDACDEKYNCARLPNGNEVVCGVERRPDTQAPVAYYFRTTADHAYVTTPYGGYLTRIPASRVVHVFTPEDEGQPRGIPWGHAILRKLKMLEEWDTAELTAARDENCTVRHYESKQGVGDAEDFTDLQTSDDPADQAVAKAMIQDKAPGQSEIVPYGYELKTSTPQHPNREVTAFKATMLRDVASGLGVEYANFANDWAGVSFSSVRLGTISERDFWMMLQADMISQDKSRVFMLWLRSFLSLSISGEFPPEKYDKFSEHQFRGRRWMWVDPMRDMASAVIARDHGWKTDTDITSDMGGDFGDNIATIKNETQDVKGTRLEAKGPVAGGSTPASRAAAILESVAKITAADEKENQDED